MRTIITIKSVNNGAATIEVVCPFCGSVTTLSVNYDALKSWIDGSAKIQDVMPDVDPSTRELLISGICKSCQDDVFGE